MTYQRRVLAVGLSGVVLGSIISPYALLPTFQASLVAAAFSLFYAFVLGFLLRKGGSRVQIGIGVSAFLSLVLTSACVGVFFHLPMKSALFLFAIISMGGAILLTAIGLFLCVKVFTDFLENHDRKQAAVPNP